MNHNIEEFREGLFALHTRRLGKVTELLIKKLYNYDKPDTNAYDLKDNDQKIEVKCSTVLRKCGEPITEDNLISAVNASRLERRALTFEKAQTEEFDCNVQQVKPKEFDILFYGCFFEDKILLCKMSSDEILENHEIFYSGKQHRGNEGEGQFHINQKTLPIHIDKYFVKWVSYEELYDLFDKKDR